MESVSALGVVIVGALCVVCFVLLAWVWAKAGEVRIRRPRRRGLERWQLVVLPLVVIASVTRDPVRDGPPDTGVLLALRIAVALALVAAVLLSDQDLRRRADDPPEQHRITVWGVSAIGAVLLAVALGTAEVAAITGDPDVTVAVPVGLAVLAVAVWLNLLLARAFRRRWRERAASAPED